MNLFLLSLINSTIEIIT